MKTCTGWELEFTTPELPYNELWETFHKCDALGDGLIEVIEALPDGRLLLIWHSISSQEAAKTIAKKLPELFSGVEEITLFKEYLTGSFCMVKKHSALRKENLCRK